MYRQMSHVDELDEHNGNQDPPSACGWQTITSSGAACKETEDLITTEVVVKMMTMTVMVVPRI